MEFVTGLIIVAALLAGIAAGWYLGGRPSHALRAECDALRAHCSKSDTDLATHQERSRDAELVRRMLDEVTGERDAARHDAAALRPVAERVARLEAELTALRSQKEALASAKAAFERGEAERQQAHETQLAQVKELEAKMEARFGELANSAVKGAHDEFLKRADERFGHAGKQSEEKLRALLAPVQDSLRQHKEIIDKVETARTENYGALTSLVDTMRVGQESVRSEASKIVTALRAAPKMKGRWAEQQFKNLIEIAGLTEHVDFEEEVSVSSEGKSLRPDFVIRMPGDKKLVVDVKCSIDSYLRGVEHESPEERKRHFTDHAKAIRQHADALSEKSYWKQFDEAPDFVIMYVHGDNFISAALEMDLELWERAARNRVIICGPSTFLPMARTVASVWRQEKLARDHVQIVNLGRDMHDRIAGAAEKIRLVGNALQSAVKNYNGLVGTYDTVISREGRKFKELNIDSARNIEELIEIEGPSRSPRLLELDDGDEKTVLS